MVASLEAFPKIFQPLLWAKSTYSAVLTFGIFLSQH